MTTLSIYIVVGLVSFLSVLYIQGSFKKRGPKNGGKR